MLEDVERRIVIFDVLKVRIVIGDVIDVNRTFPTDPQEQRASADVVLFVEKESLKKERTTLGKRKFKTCLHVSKLEALK